MKIWACCLVGTLGFYLPVLVVSFSLLALVCSSVPIFTSFKGFLPGYDCRVHALRKLEHVGYLELMSINTFSAMSSGYESLMKKCFYYGTSEY